ncbi:hypothetical protein H6F98_06815 [Microcoleus sp. FACHB-SPT15]|uniref:hypothetical protein n=1 Tax=Microcoleus sp. FACHB-SPT15 TaxID=2692830 RepID=UPI00177BAB9C|nr:hypothetical protein [Microcoleus sp. FACHB-SPT15]MBD1805159.1 hypothetical protein [Microcoleus sp. FACHB-SPT15]
MLKTEDKLDLTALLVMELKLEDSMEIAVPNAFNSIPSASWRFFTYFNFFCRPTFF